MAATDDILDEGQVDAALAELPDWRYRLGGLVTAYKAPTAAAALELLAAVGRLAEEPNHPPDLAWRSAYSGRLPAIESPCCRKQMRL